MALDGIYIRCLAGVHAGELYVISLQQSHHHTDWTTVDTVMQHDDEVARCLQVTERGILIAGESGIFTPDHVAFVQQAGCGAILVGESLVKTGDPAAAVKALLA